MHHRELIKKYIKFFKSKGHKEIPNVSLIPEKDPTVLFTTAGMHPLVPYFLGQKHPLGKRLTNVQRCVRTVDIEEVGNETHHTFFEMLGNWSLGDYWKKGAIEYSLEFLKKILKIPTEKLAVTCFKGDKNASKDKESAKIWKTLGIPEERIVFLGKEDNWWGPAGKTGPCGPNTEMFYWASPKPAPKKFNPKDKTWVEIWNDVFMQYNKNERGNYDIIDQKNVDTGMGVERTLSTLNNLNDDYLTEIFKPIIEKIEKLSRKKYGQNKEETISMRIIADHIKAAVFIIADGIVPSNTEQGYVLRRLIRRAVYYGRELGMKNFMKEMAEPVFKIYDDYKHLQKNKRKILEELQKEEERFNRTLEKGVRKCVKIFKEPKKISSKEVFLLFQSFGFPKEMIKEQFDKVGLKFPEKGFEKELRKHQELSRTARAGKFKSGLADHSEETTKLHTATHLLLAALRIVLKNKNIVQKGSNITPERLRFDFNHKSKLTNDEIKKVEDLVNKKIKEGLDVKKEEMDLKTAKKKGAVGLFDKKYGKKVSVYSIGDFSKEICAGPHVKNTSELGHFKIIKEESVAAGIRRIKAILE